jgi:ribokinase
VLGLGHVTLDIWDGVAAGLGSCVGDSTANTLALLVRFGHSADLVAAAGDDAEAGQCLAELAALGVGVRHVLRRAGRLTRRIRITVDERGDRAFRISRRNVATPPTLDEVLGLGVNPADYDAFHSAVASRATLALTERFRWASYNGQRCRGSRREIALHRQIIEGCHVVAFSHGYLAAVLGLRGPAPVRAGALDILQGPVLKVVTLGARGAAASFGGRLYHAAALDLPAFGLAAVDTTGAGDAFHAGLLHTLLARASSPRDVTREHVLAALRFASQAAGLVCSAFGTKRAMSPGDYATRFGDAPAVREIGPETPLFEPDDARQAMCRGVG